jgi:hypothetical protein
MNSGGLFNLQRKMALEGRVNLVFEEIAPSQTRVTANTRYVVTRTQTVTAAGNGMSHTSNANVTFNSGATGAFAPGPDGRFAECVATGDLENDILSSFN